MGNSLQITNREGRTDPRLSRDSSILRSPVADRGSPTHGEPRSLD